MLAESDRSCGSQTQAAVETSAATRIPRPTATLGTESGEGCAAEREREPD